MREISLRNNPGFADFARFLSVVLVFVFVARLLDAERCFLAPALLSLSKVGSTRLRIFWDLVIYATTPGTKRDIKINEIGEQKIDEAI